MWRIVIWVIAHGFRPLVRRFTPGIRSGCAVAAGCLYNFPLGLGGLAIDLFNYIFDSNITNPSFSKKKRQQNAPKKEAFCNLIESI